MPYSRRKFLTAGTLVALSAAIPLRVSGQQLRKENDANPIDQSKDVAADPLANYTRSAFSSHLNSIFRLYAGYSFIDVALVEVKDVMPASVAAPAGSECFSLVFRGESSALRQNTYGIEHPSLGVFSLFLVPGGTDENGRQSYVAIVNRLAYSPALLAPPSRLAKPAIPDPRERVLKPVKTTSTPPVTQQKITAPESKGWVKKALT